MTTRPLPCSFTGCKVKESEFTIAEIDEQIAEKKERKKEKTIVSSLSMQRLSSHSRTTHVGDTDS